MFAYRRLRSGYFALPLILASFGAASANEVSKPLLACISKAAAEEQVEYMLGREDRTPQSATIVLICEGPVASALFQAMEPVATDDLSLSPSVMRRSGNGVKCARSGGPPPYYVCYIEIDVEAPLAKAIKTY
jgi:hypothetical protein